MRRLLLLLVVLLRSGISVAQDAPPIDHVARTYDVLYSARIVPTQRSAHVSIRVGPGAEHLRYLRFDIDLQRHVDFTGDGKLEVGNNHVLWKPPASGGTLRYQFLIDHLRDERSYDSRCAESWAIFRGDDLIPPVRVRARRGAQSVSRLRLRLPSGWSAAAPYPRDASGEYQVAHPHRRFDRPTGWIVVGKLGAVRERVSGVHVTVVGPAGHGQRRLDLLAMLRWTLPELRKVLGVLPEHLLVVGAGDPMWRGGLSASGSVYLHADRPLLTRDVTSPLLHEVVHATTHLSPGRDGDWVVEGIADLYSLELLRRSSTIGKRRYERALERIAERGRAVTNIRVRRASGAVTARAVAALHALDEEIRSSSGGARSLDDVVRALVEHAKPITTAKFRQIAETMAGKKLGAFFGRYVPHADDPVQTGGGS